MFVVSVPQELSRGKFFNGRPMAEDRSQKTENSCKKQGGVCAPHLISVICLM
jgi:hypothetical protein